MTQNRWLNAGVTALVIADDDSVLQRLPANPADILISCGDIAGDVVLEAASRSSCKQIVAVKGNHDSSAPFQAPIFDLHLTSFKFGGKTFGGFCGAWRYKPRGNYLFDQDEVERFLALFPPVDIFVAHNSPRHIHDREDEVHLGFTAFNTYIARAKPRFFLHGHQHQDIESRLENTVVVGTFGHRYLVLDD